MPVDVRQVTDDDLIREYDLRESSVEELRQAVNNDTNLATLLRQKMEDECLDIPRAQWLVRLGFGVNLPYQYFDVWWIHSYLVVPEKRPIGESLWRGRYCDSIACGRQVNGGLIMRLVPGVLVVGRSKQSLQGNRSPGPS